MSDPSVATLPRQMGLMEAADIIANNIANASTPGFKGEGTIFAEHVARGGQNFDSVSMGHLTARSVNFSTGAMDRTGGTFDLAINGEGFFKVQTDNGERLTRAGTFLLNLDGALVTPQGDFVTDDGGAPIELPPDSTNVVIARDGTLSVDGEDFAKVGVFAQRGEMIRVGGNMWNPIDGDDPVEEPQVLQGFVESSNVDAVSEFAKLIAVQRFFEAGQTLVEQDHERLSQLIAAIRTQG